MQENFFLSKKAITTILLAIGTLLCYAAGTLWLIFVGNTASSTYTLWSSLTVCVLPYIIPDGIKLFAAYRLSKRLRPIINKTTRTDNI